MKKVLLGIAASALSATLATSAFAGDLKIGVVDMDQVLQKAPLMISLNNQLQSKFKDRQDELNSANKDLQDESNQLNNNLASMSTDERSKLQNKIITDKANVQVLAANFQRDVSLAKDQDMKIFMSKLNDAIMKVARDGRYDLIQQRTNIPYVNPQLDVTQKILQQLS